MRTEHIIINRGFQKLASFKLMGPLASKPMASLGAGEMLSRRLQSPTVPSAPRETILDKAAPSVNKALNTALSAYKTKGKYTDSGGMAMPGKYKGLSFKGKF
jgi:hypothetical protein